MKMKGLDFRKHFVFSDSLLFIWGLIFSFSFVEYGAVSLLIDYFTNSWEGQNLPKAAILTNIQDSLSTLLAFMFVAPCSEAYIGRFRMIVFCIASYVSGLLMLWISGPSRIFSLYVAMVLIGLGKSVRDPALQGFLEYQLEEIVRSNAEAHPENQSENEERSIDIATNIWWRSAWFSGALTIFFLIENAPTRNTFKIAALLMIATYILFLYPMKFYFYEAPNSTKYSFATKINGVFNAALSKWNMRYPNSVERYYWKNERPNNFFTTSSQKIRLLPRMPFVLGWLDKAALVGDSDPQREEMNGKLYSAHYVRLVKWCYLVFFIAGTFIAYDLVVAAGNTFFVSQASNMKSDFSMNKMFIMKSILKDLVIFMFWIFKSEKKGVAALKVCASMLCAIACSITARTVELHRLSSIEKEGILENPNGSISMGNSILVPQFMLLGLMEALGDGGRTILSKQASSFFGSFDSTMNDYLSGAGKFLTIPFVLIFKGWFKESVNTSHLDRYYLMLAVLNGVHLLGFLLFFCDYFSKKEEDEE